MSTWGCCRARGQAERDVSLRTGGAATSPILTAASLATTCSCAPATLAASPTAAHAAGTAHDASAHAAAAPDVEAHALTACATIASTVCATAAQTVVAPGSTPRVTASLHFAFPPDAFAAAAPPGSCRTPGPPGTNGSASPSLASQHAAAYRRVRLVWADGAGDGWHKTRVG